MRHAVASAVKAPDFENPQLLVDGLSDIPEVPLSKIHKSPSLGEASTHYIEGIVGSSEPHGSSSSLLVLLKPEAFCDQIILGSRLTLNSVKVELKRLGDSKVQSNTPEEPSLEVLNSLMGTSKD